MLSEVIEHHVAGALFVESLIHKALLFVHVVGAIIAQIHSQAHAWLTLIAGHGHCFHQQFLAQAATGLAAGQRDCQLGDFGRDETRGVLFLGGIPQPGCADGFTIFFEDYTALLGGPGVDI